MERNCGTGGTYLVPFLACFDVFVLSLRGVFLLYAGKYCQKSLEVSGAALSLVNHGAQS
jgi:hypothetical protein